MSCIRYIIPFASCEGLCTLQLPALLLSSKSICHALEETHKTSFSFQLFSATSTHFPYVQFLQLLLWIRKWSNSEIHYFVCFILQQVTFMAEILLLFVYVVILFYYLIQIMLFFSSTNKFTSRETMGQISDCCLNVNLPQCLPLLPHCTMKKVSGINRHVHLYTV